MDKQRSPIFIFGVNPVLEKLRAAPREVAEVILARGAQRPALRSVEEEARRLGRRVRYVEPELLQRLSEGARHQGVLAKVEGFSYGSFEDLFRELSSAPGHDSILFLDGVTDPRNFGALLRSAEGAGIRHIVIPKHRSVGVTPVVVKTSAGAAHYLKIYRASNLRRALSSVKERGYWVVGLDAQAKESLYTKSYPEKLAVVLGAEGAGIRPLIQQECDFLVSIPMRGEVQSLNVAVAGGIFLYELLRQKGKF